MTNGGLIEVVFGFNTADSTIAGYDTIELRLVERLSPPLTDSATLSNSQQNLGKLQMSTANFATSNSLVTFTSTFSQDLTTRVEISDAQ